MNTFLGLINNIFTKVKEFFGLSTGTQITTATKSWTDASGTIHLTGAPTSTTATKPQLVPQQLKPLILEQYIMMKMEINIIYEMEKEFILETRYQQE